MELFDQDLGSSGEASGGKYVMRRSENRKQAGQEEDNLVVEHVAMWGYRDLQFVM